MKSNHQTHSKAFRPAALVLLAGLVPANVAAECRTDFAAQTAARTSALLESKVSSAVLARLEPDRHAAQLAESARTRMKDIEKAMELRLAQSLEDKRVQVLARSRPDHFAARPEAASEEIVVAADRRYEPAREEPAVVGDRRDEPVAAERDLVAMSRPIGCQ